MAHSGDRIIMLPRRDLRRRLTLLSTGVGQNSQTTWQLLLRDREFRHKYAPGEIVLAFGDTNDEHDELYVTLERTKARCATLGIPFLHVKPGMGYHTGVWSEGLLPAWEKTSTIGSVAFPSTCSPRLKTEPVYRAFADYLRKERGYDFPDHKPIVRYAEEHGLIRVLINFGLGEEKRRPTYSVPEQLCLIKPDKKPRREQPLWREKSVKLEFPLIDLGLGRAECIDYLGDTEDAGTLPSLCFSCHWKSPLLLWWSYRKDKARFMRWVAAEDRKLDTWGDEDYRRTKTPPKKIKRNSEYKNHGVSGRGEFVNGKWKARRLLHVLFASRKEYEHLPLAELERRVRQMGHCAAKAFAA